MRDRLWGCDVESESLIDHDADSDTVTDGETDNDLERPPLSVMLAVALELGVCVFFVIEIDTDAVGSTEGLTVIEEDKLDE